MACDAAICIDPYAACDLIFSATVCPHTPDGNCGIMTPGTSGNGTTCTAVCTQQRVHCLGSIATSSCSSGDGWSEGTCNTPLLAEALVECVCAPYCEEADNRPCRANESCTYSVSSSTWECTPNS